MPDRRVATAYACLAVVLSVAEPSHLAVTVGDHVRLDRVVDGGVQRHGELLAPGTTTLRLAEGTYVFRTTHDAQVRLGDDAAVHVAAVDPNNKTGNPPPPPIQSVLPAAKGDAAPDRVPTLTVLSG